LLEVAGWLAPDGGDAEPDVESPPPPPQAATSSDAAIAAIESLKFF
jgi:hypothetical protein